MVHRSGAKPGDRVVVTGTIGDAALGLDDPARAARPLPRLLAMLRRSEMLIEPLPRAAAAQRAGTLRCAITPMRRWTSPTGSPAISQNCALRPACRPRSMRPSVPLSAAAASVAGARRASASRRSISGGDDYEILCAIPEDRFEAFAQAARQAGVAVTSIRHDRRRRRRRPQFLDAQGRELAADRACSCSHF